MQYCEIVRTLTINQSGWKEYQSLKCVMWYEEIEVVQCSAKDKEMQSTFGRYEFVAVKWLTCQTFNLQAGNSSLGMNLHWRSNTSKEEK